MTNKKIIGILGGMGPAATVNFLDIIVKLSQIKYKASQDTDFSKIYLYNTALEGFNETGFENTDLVKKQLIDDIKKLSSWRPSFIVMPCNTVHYFINELRNSTNIPIISIIESTILEIKKFEYNKLGIICSESTRSLGLYEEKFKKENISYIISNDNEQNLLNDVIFAVMEGKQGKKESEILKNIIKRMKEDGAQAIVLGCTELPLAINEAESDLPILNTIKILAEKAVDLGR